MSTPSCQVIHVFVELIEKPLRPSIDVAISVQIRTFHLRPAVRLVFLPLPEKMQGDIIGRQHPTSNRPPNAVQHVIAMRLAYNLHACRCNFGQEFPHRRLPGRVEMYFGVLDQEQSVDPRGQGRHHDRQNLGQPKSGVDRTMEARISGCSKPQRYDIGFLNFLESPTQNPERTVPSRLLPEGETE